MITAHRDRRPVTRPTTATIVGKQGVSYSRGGRIVLHVFLIVVALLWLVPIGAAIYTSFRFLRARHRT